MSVSLSQEIDVHCPWSAADGLHKSNLVHFTPGFLSGLSVASVPSWMHRNLSAPLRPH